MKRFWKKANRGLILGGALIVILLAVLLVGELRFRAETPVIADRACEAVASLLKLNISPEDAQLASPLSESARAERKAQMEAYLSEYWTADRSSLYYSEENDVRLAFDTLLGKEAAALFFDMDVEIPKGAVSVESNGPDCAMVEIAINRVNATFLGDGEQLFCGDLVEAGSLAREGGTQAYLGMYRGYASLEMHRENGEWRVCGISAYLNLYTKTATELAGGGK